MAAAEARAAATGGLVARPAAEVDLVVPRDRLAAVLKALAECGCLHPREAGDESLATRLRSVRNELDALKQRLQEMLEQALAAGAGAEQGEAVIELSERVDESLERLVSGLSEALRDVEKLVERLSQLRSPETELGQLLAVLEAYSFIDVDVEALKKGKWLRAKVYRVPGDRAHGFVEELRRIGAVVGVWARGVERENDTVAVAYPAQLEAEVGRAAVRSRAVPLELPPDLPRSPAAALRELRRELEEAPQLLRRHAPRILEALRLVEAAERLLELLSAVRLTRLLAIVRGYVAEERLGELRGAVEAAAGSYVALTLRYLPGHGGHHGGEEEAPPSYYRAPRRLEFLRDLLDMAGQPRPYEIVPLALMAVTLPLIYGLVFPDMGHGLVLILAGYYLFMKKMGDPNLGKFVMLVGAAAMVTGFLAGEFFGPHPAVAGWLNSVWHGHPPLASPLHPFIAKLEGAEVNAEELAHHATLLIYRAIYVSLAVGSTLLAVASWLSIANGLLQRDREMVAAGIGKSLLFTGVMLAMLLGPVMVEADTALQAAGSVLADAGLTLVPQTPLGTLVRVMATAGLLTLLAAPLAFGHGSTGERLTAGVMEAFDALLMAIGNTASFMRIMGLMLAHSGLMLGFTVLAYVAGPALGAIAYILGNILVIGLEALVAYAHTLRLHFYEMFSKFYLDQGQPYTPVKLPPGTRIALATAKR